MYFLRCLSVDIEQKHRLDLSTRLLQSALFDIEPATHETAYIADTEDINKNHNFYQSYGEIEPEKISEKNPTKPS